MRELVVEDQEVLIIPQNFKFANRGKVRSVTAGDFTMEMDYEPDGILENTYCEFFTQTSHGKLYFDSYAKKIDGKMLTIASPAKHKFLQRRQYTRIKFVKQIQLTCDGENITVNTLDISAGGMKFLSGDNVMIDKTYDTVLNLNDKLTVECKFQPIRIERTAGKEYSVSGQFIYKTEHDRMMVVQYCAKRSVEINNK